MAAGGARRRIRSRRIVAACSTGSRRSDPRPVCRAPPRPGIERRPPPASPACRAGPTVYADADQAAQHRAARFEHKRAHAGRGPIKMVEADAPGGARQQRSCRLRGLETAWGRYVRGQARQKPASPRDAGCDKSCARSRTPATTPDILTEASRAVGVAARGARRPPDETSVCNAIGMVAAGTPCVQLSTRRRADLHGAVHRLN